MEKVASCCGAILLSVALTHCINWINNEEQPFNSFKLVKKWKEFGQRSQTYITMGSGVCFGWVRLILRLFMDADGSLFRLKIFYPKRI